MTKFLLTSALAVGAIAINLAATVLPADITLSTAALPGGDPRIQLCGKLTGDVTKAEWETTAEVKVVGCVPGARITMLALCIRNCEGKAEALSSPNGTLTAAMKKMIGNLPKGTPFVVRVSVKDEKGRDRQVPDAAFVWKG